jgi:hypothetical protein
LQYSVLLPTLFMRISNGVIARLMNNKGTKSQRDYKISLDNFTYTEKPLKNIKYYYNKLFVYPFVEFLDDISVQFIVGLLVVGLITYAVPENIFSDSIISNDLLGMQILILINIPMYVYATASIPIVVSLMFTRCRFCFSCGWSSNKCNITFGYYKSFRKENNSGLCLDDCRYVNFVRFVT